MLFVGVCVRCLMFVSCVVLRLMCIVSECCVLLCLWFAVIVCFVLVVGLCVLCFCCLLKVWCLFVVCGLANVPCCLLVGMRFWLFVKCAVLFRMLRSVLQMCGLWCCLYCRLFVACCLLVVVRRVVCVVC